MSNEKSKKNKALYILTHDFKYEGLILLFLAIVAIVLGVLILNGSLVINENAWLIGDYPRVFSWTLVILGIVSLLLSVWPFYKPSIDEMRRVTWPTQGRIVSDSVTVIVFTAIMSVFFFFVNIGLTAVIDWLAGLGHRI